MTKYNRIKEFISRRFHVPGTKADQMDYNAVMLSPAETEFLAAGVWLDDVASRLQAVSNKALDVEVLEHDTHDGCIIRFWHESFPEWWGR